MNWKSILVLSSLGLFIGAASLFGVPRVWESLLWALAGSFCAAWISTRIAARPLRDGFLVGCIGGALAPLVQGLFISTYLAHNPEFAAGFQQLSSPLSHRTLILMSAPVAGVLSGVALAAMSWLGAKIFWKMMRPGT